MKKFKLDFDSQLAMVAKSSESWPLLKDHLVTFEESFKPGNYKVFNLDPYNWICTVRLLPYRKASSTSDAKAAINGERPCFLCRKNRPAEQTYLEIGDYEMLANPNPILSGHLTLAKMDHTPQLIKGHEMDMAELAQLFKDGVVFYNGPLCGASAPDHLHFQVVDRFAKMNLKIPNEMCQTVYKLRKSSILIPFDDVVPFQFIIIDADDLRDFKILFERVYNALPQGDPEPMMNIAMYKKGSNGVRAVIIPRKAHRPSFYGTGDGQLLLSPATLEMLGFFPAIAQKEFDGIDESVILDTYRQVGFSFDDMAPVYEKILTL